MFEMFAAERAAMQAENARFRAALEKIEAQGCASEIGAQGANCSALYVNPIDWWCAACIARVALDGGE